MLEGSAAEGVACKSGRGPSGPSEALVDIASSSSKIYRFKNLYSESSEVGAGLAAGRRQRHRG